MQPEITTECPDFFKMKVEGTDQEKWVLNQAGRYYRIGDFKKVDGKWTFVSEAGASPINFSKDSYAAQTYYGTGENGTPDGRRIMINWMNNWDYCNQVKKITGTFNGAYTLQNELKLVQTDDGIRLRQQPIEEYKSLRQNPITYNGVISSDSAANKAAININNLSGSQYEIVAEFEPDANTTEFGFKLRVGKDVDQETIVKYDVETGEVVIDRSKSGKTPVSGSTFANSYSSAVNKTADGKIQLHIFVDAASVEVYGNDGEVAGTWLIFPDRNSTGIEAYSVGGNTQANINYYPLKGIWNNENASVLSLSEATLTKEVGNEFTIYTSVIPSTSTQGVTWNISNPSIATILSQDDKKTTFRVLGEGNANLTATSKDGKLQKTTTLSVVNHNLPSTFSGLSDVEVFGTDWYKDGDAYVGNGSGDGFAMLGQMNYDSTATYTFETDVEIAKGTAGLVLGSAEKNSPSQCSVVANLNREGAWRLFKFPGGANIPDNEHGAGNVTPDANGKYHMNAVLKGNHIQYYIDDTLISEADYSFSAPGNFGFNIFNANVKFTNAKLTVTGSDISTLGIVKTNYEQNIGDEFTIYANQNVKYKIGNQDVVQILNGTDSQKTTFKVVGTGETTITVTPSSGSADPVTITVAGYDTNPDNTSGLIIGLKNFTTSGDGKWYVKKNADDVSYAVKSTGDTFAMSSTKISAIDGANYTLETEATVENPNDHDCAPSLVLFSKSKDNPKDGSLVFNIQTNNGHWKVFEFGGSLIGEGNITPTGDGKYDLKVDVVGQTVKYSINGQEVLSSSDFTRRSGYVGLMSWNANTEFRNTVFKSVDPNTTLGISTSYEKLKGEEFTINANQSVTYTSSDPAIVNVISGNGSNATTFKVNGAGPTTINAVSDNNPELQETIAVTGLETNPNNFAGLVTGLDGFDTIGGKWYVKDGAYVSEGGGDKFSISDTTVNVTTGAACTFSTEATIKSSGAAALILSKDKTKPADGSIVANVDKNGNWRIFGFPNGYEIDDIDGNNCAGKLGTVPEDGVYTLKFVVNGTNIEYYINDELVCTVDASDYGFENCYVGLMNWDAKIEFRDTKFTE